MLELEKESDLFSKSKRDKKLEEFVKLKERVAEITKREEKTQGEFDSYIGSLDAKCTCKFTSGIKNVVTACGNSLFECKFRGEEKYNISGTFKSECKRDNMVKISNLL